MESKLKCKCYNEAKKGCKVMALDDKIKILDKSRGGMRAAAVDLTFSSQFTLKPNIPSIFYLLYA